MAGECPSIWVSTDGIRSYDSGQGKEASEDGRGVRLDEAEKSVAVGKVVGGDIAGGKADAADGASAADSTSAADGVTAADGMSVADGAGAGGDDR